MLFKAVLEKKRNEQNVLREFDLLESVHYTDLFTSLCIYFAWESYTSLLYHIWYFDISDSSDVYEAERM